MTLPSLEDRPIDHLVKIAAQNPQSGIVEEPRVLYDVIRVPSATNLTQRSNIAAFRNGENFPMVLSHMLAFVRPRFESGGYIGLDEAAIQRIALRLERDGQVYQNLDLQPAPLWHNKVATGNPAIQRSAMSWTFDRPFVLPMRASLDVRLSRLPIALDDLPVGFSVRGTGLVSGQPVVLATTGALGSVVLNLSADDLRNPRTEPIALTDATIWTAQPEKSEGSLGDLRLVNVAIQGAASGTGRAWCQGPQVDGNQNFAPAYLLGQCTGRCITHRLPSYGIRLEPGDRFFAEVAAMDDDAYDLDLALGFLGTLFVT